VNTPTRLAAFGAALSLAFGGAALAGAAIDPTDEGPARQHAAEGARHGADSGGEPLSGLAVAHAGYAFEIDRRLFSAGDTAPFTFRITDQGGRALRDGFQLQHERELHLIVVRRDTAGFDHLHPTRGQDGTWSVDLNLRAPGAYRAYADFMVGGEKRTLATDLFVPGDFQPNPLPAPQLTVRAVDGADSPGDLDVTLDAPGVRAGRETVVAFVVAKGGQPFEQLEPYLGAKGHLVALREGDLAYLHVHPVEAASEHARKDGPTTAGAAGNEIGFAATFPTPGRYRLFLQFKSGGEIRTASYTVEVPR